MKEDVTFHFSCFYTNLNFLIGKAFFMKGRNYQKSKTKDDDDYSGEEDDDDDEAEDNVSKKGVS